MTSPASTDIDTLLGMSRDTAGGSEQEVAGALTSLAARQPGSTAEHDIWRRAARRRREAIQDLVRSHGPRLRRYLVGMLGPAAPVEDLVQDAFITALDSLHELRDDAHPSTWLHGIARNLARNWRRKEANRAQLTLQTPQAEAQARGTTPNDPERQHDHRQSLARMQALLTELPDSEHEAFVLRHLNEYSLTAVARLQGVAVSTASARVKRAEHALRRAMKGSQQ